MTKVKKNFKARLDLACGTDELRPAMQNMIFESGFVICTDAHILVKQHLSLHGFEPEEIEQMNGYGLHVDTFKEIMRYQEVKIQDGHFICSKGKAQAKFELEKVQGFPNWKYVVPELRDGIEIDTICFNLKLMDKISKIVIPSSFGPQCNFKFFGENKATLVKGMERTFEEELILLMPVMTKA